MPATPSDKQLADRFHPVFDRIADSAVQREQDDTRPFEAVQWLREAGFGTLRVPVQHGGLGASFEQLFRLLIELGEADSNLPQILRAHFASVERLRSIYRSDAVPGWFQRITQGALVGSGVTEPGNVPNGDIQTRLHQRGDAWVINGVKSYSTGSLYADWINVLAKREDGETVNVLVDVKAPGVERADDWLGFGQRQTGSGTTRLVDVPVADADVFLPRLGDATYIPAFVQTIHLATLAGIGRAVVRDAAGFVRARTRSYSHGSGTLPRHDTAVQQVIGQLASTSFATDATVLAVARALDRLEALAQAGDAGDEDYLDIELLASKAQVAVVDIVLPATTRLFEVGGASALDRRHQFDRHWRNARTLASHNPVIYKERAIGASVLNGERPVFSWSVGTPTL
ncbi:acyl-CoA dehydrogenase [Pigmentiphaga aceris]|uniref:Dibenzothiophene monooxygenase n=1 Tax=Pigmentiphaga aceris TaxID=1940612 RepID=A0A5C0AR11_9BURK|nr:acyl-CoA dehydrogenase family protein [Pigmentiphaga aceris]QEI04529.1 acyl-CoA dehydrogenase [Pigmentiphaga aceris]